MPCMMDCVSSPPPGSEVIALHGTLFDWLIQIKEALDGEHRKLIFTSEKWATVIPHALYLALCRRADLDTEPPDKTLHWLEHTKTINLRPVGQSHSAIDFNANMAAKQFMTNNGTNTVARPPAPSHNFSVGKAEYHIQCRADITSAFAETKCALTLYVDCLQGSHPELFIDLVQINDEGWAFAHHALLAAGGGVGVTAVGTLYVLEGTGVKAIIPIINLGDLTGNQLTLADVEFALHVAVSRSFIKSDWSCNGISLTNGRACARLDMQAIPKLLYPAESLGDLVFVTVVIKQSAAIITTTAKEGYYWNGWSDDFYNKNHLSAIRMTGIGTLLQPIANGLGLIISPITCWAAAVLTSAQDRTMIITQYGLPTPRGTYHEPTGTGTTNCTLYKYAGGPNHSVVWSSAPPPAPVYYDTDDDEYQDAVVSLGAAVFGSDEDSDEEEVLGAAVFGSDEDSDDDNVDDDNDGTGAAAALVEPETAVPVGETISPEISISDAPKGMVSIELKPIPGTILGVVANNGRYIFLVEGPTSASVPTSAAALASPNVNLTGFTADGHECVLGYLLGQHTIETITLTKKQFTSTVWLRVEDNWYPSGSYVGDIQALGADERVKVVIAYGTGPVPAPGPDGGISAVVRGVTLGLATLGITEMPPKTDDFYRRQDIGSYITPAHLGTPSLLTLGTCGDLTGQFTKGLQFLEDDFCLGQNGQRLFWEEPTGAADTPKTHRLVLQGAIDDRTLHTDKSGREWLYATPPFA